MIQYCEAEERQKADTSPEQIYVAIWHCCLLDGRRRNIAHKCTPHRVNPVTFPARPFVLEKPERLSVDVGLVYRRNKARTRSRMGILLANLNRDLRDPVGPHGEILPTPAPAIHASLSFFRLTGPHHNMTKHLGRVWRSKYVAKSVDVLPSSLSVRKYLTTFSLNSSPSGASNLNFDSGKPLDKTSLSLRPPTYQSTEYGISRKDVGCLFQPAGDCGG